MTFHEMHVHLQVMFLVVYFFINLGLAALSVYRYWDSNIYVIIARVCGMCLNFNCTLILILMLRLVHH